jgi:hypothetical protein
MDARCEDGYTRSIGYSRNRSEGRFSDRPIARPPKKPGSAAGTDAYDTIDWLVKNVRVRRKVRIISSSISKLLAARAGDQPHPRAGRHRRHSRGDS